MYLPLLAVKSVVKPNTNPMPCSKDMEDSPRLTTDPGQTLIGLVCYAADTTLEILVNFNIRVAKY